MNSLRLSLSVLSLLFFCVGCNNQSASDAAPAIAEGGKNTFLNSDITGAPYARDFSLTDHNGSKKSLKDFRGKIVVVFFGYTHCPDVCPATLWELATALKKMGESAKKIQVLFITLDPTRDTPALLAQYVPSFNPTFLGLSGSAEDIAKTAKEFKIFYQSAPSASDKNYTIDHTAGTYIFDQNGRIRLFARYGQTADSLVQDMKELLKKSS